MALITLCHLHLLQPHPHPLPSSPLLYHPFHFMPSWQSHLHPPALVLFIFSPSKSQLQGKTPATCGWTKQLHRNSNRHKEDSLSDVTDDPGPLLVLCIYLSLSHKERLCYHAKQNLGAKLSFPIQGLKGRSLQALERKHSRLSLALHVCA